MKKYILILLILSTKLFSQKLLIQMDLTQNDHLKAYGIAFWIVKDGNSVDWLLNYRGGSFLTDYTDKVAAECRIRGVSFETISSGQADQIIAEVKAENVNMDLVKLEKAPKIAVYAPPGALPWDDAVRLALEYAEVEHDIIYDEEVMEGKLKEYDWLHLHHEDFTGQYGKFWRSYRNAPWYIQQVSLNEAMAQKLGFAKVSKLKLAVVLKMREYISNGGFIFAMCSAPDSFDVALAAQNTDICESMFDGDPMDPRAQEKLDFSQTVAFENFKIVKNPSEYEISSLDVGPTTINNPDIDFFTLFEFSAKYDPVPTMLTQNHQAVIPGFLGQTTAFKETEIKKDVIKLGKREGTDEVKYIYGNYGRGFFAFYGGHDPEDYRHGVGDPPTELRLHKNSPSYRLILNNVLFPAAKKKEQKT
jgi:hypothetical protein